jgi:hypothetical protein
MPLWMAPEYVSVSAAHEFSGTFGAQWPMTEPFEVRTH